MIKVSKKLLSLISISTGVIAIILGLLVLRHFQPQVLVPSATAEPPSDLFLEQSAFTPEPELEATATQSIESSKISSKITSKIRATARPELLPSPTPMIPWMQFGDVSLLNLPTVMTFNPGCEAKPIKLPEFKVIPWSSDVLTGGAFNVTRKTVVAWEHLGFTGYWIHSGLDWLGKPLAAFPLQDYLEKLNGWQMRTPEQFDQNAADCLIGSKVSMQVGEELLVGKVTAVLRIPASEVKTVSSHVMDLVSYLAKTYPASGFDQLEAPELLLYFCGKQLATEKADRSVEYYAQSRIIVAIDFGF